MQCLAWSSPEPNPAHWEKRCALKQPFVVVIDSEIAGFLELDPDGHIDCAYTNPDFARRGVMTALVRHAVQTVSERKLPRIYVEASICLKPLLEIEGFETLSERTVTIDGITLTNFKMERRCSSGPTDPVGIHLEE